MDGEENLATAEQQPQIEDLENQNENNSDVDQPADENQDADNENPAGENNEVAEAQDPNDEGSAINSIDYSQD